MPRPNLGNFDRLIGTLRTMAERGLRERFRMDGWFEGPAQARRRLAARAVIGPLG